MVQISETLEGAFLAFRCRVNVALRNRHAAMTRDLLDSEGVCASFTKPSQKRVAQGVYHAVFWKLQITSKLLVKMRLSLKESPRSKSFAGSLGVQLDSAPLMGEHYSILNPPQKDDEYRSEAPRTANKSIQLGSETTAGPFPCPDCQHECSRYAEMCPACGRFFRSYDRKVLPGKGRPYFLRSCPLLFSRSVLAIGRVHTSSNILCLLSAYSLSSSKSRSSQSQPRVSKLSPR